MSGDCSAKFVVAQLYKIAAGKAGFCNWCEQTRYSDLLQMRSEAQTASLSYIISTWACCTPCLHMLLDQHFC